MSRRGRAATGATALTLLMSACGVDERTPEPTRPPPVLSAQALPDLNAATRALDRPALARSTPLPGLSERLATWRFTRAVEREFTGVSRDLAHVVSRTVDFADAAGARAYQRTLVRGTDSYLGPGAQIAPLKIDGRSGWIVRAPSCGCRAQPPTLVAVIRRGGRVSWLALSGTGATPQRVRGLAARLP